MKMANLRVTIDLSNHSWIEATEDHDETRYMSGGGDLPEDFDENKVWEALDKLKEAVLE